MLALTPLIGRSLMDSDTVVVHTTTYGVVGGFREMVGQDELYSGTTLIPVKRASECRLLQNH